MQNSSLEQLKVRLAGITDLAQVASLVGWDQMVMMPQAGAALRANQRATLTKVIFEQFTSPETGRLLDEVASLEDSLDPESDDAALIRLTRRDYEKAVRVPSELRSDIARASSEGVQAWARAKEASDFSLLLPALERAIELRQNYIDCFDDYDERYDVLLDDFEPEMKSAEVRAVFQRMKDELLSFISGLGDAEPDDAFLTGHFPVDRQQALCHEVIDLFGLKPETWRLDDTRHPFVGGPGSDDVRITTHYDETNLDALFASMHEYGHALYENQVARELARGPLGRGCSLGLHESQSRMWENLVGRSLPFWRFFFPRLQELFPDALSGYDAERWYREVNAVQPSLIRVEADEATYNLHIILRFELEQEMLAGSVELEQLPEEWNRRMWEYLGIEVPDDTRGVLQDTHWAGGSVGYFPTYALGNLISAQIWERIVSDLPGLHDEFEQGEFGSLRDWLRENLHRHGRKFTPLETLERVSGAPKIDPEPYVRYLRSKLGEIYGLPVAG